MRSSLVIIKCKGLHENTKHKNTLRVYYFRQAAHYNSVEQLSNLLSEEEKKRANAFRFENDKLSYIVCHGILRRIISKETGEKPENLSFFKDKNDKPYLTGNPVYFNISHTKEMCAIAISEKTDPGIDIEKIKENKHFEDIAKRHFTFDEQAYLSASDNPVRDFYLIWTRKEAFLKNIGTGIKAGLKNINVGKETNSIDTEPFTQFSDKKIDPNFSIYSGEIEDHILSVAVSNDTFIELIHFLSE